MLPGAVIPALASLAGTAIGLPISARSDGASMGSSPDTSPAGSPDDNTIDSSRQSDSSGLIGVSEPFLLAWAPDLVDHIDMARRTIEYNSEYILGHNDGKHGPNPDNKAALQLTIPDDDGSISGIGLLVCRKSLGDVDPTDHDTLKYRILGTGKEHDLPPKSCRAIGWYSAEAIVCNDSEEGDTVTSALWSKGHSDTAGPMNICEGGGSGGRSTVGVVQPFNRPNLFFITKQAKQD